MNTNSHARAAALGDDTMPRDVGATKDRLNSALAGHIQDYVEISDVIADAYRSGARDVVPLLLTLARTFTQDERRSTLLAHEALGTAALLADIREELLEMAEQHERNPLLARYSILILGRDADAKTLEILERVHNESHNNFVRGAVSGARRALHLEERRARLKQPREEIDLAT